MDQKPTNQRKLAAEREPSWPPQLPRRGCCVFCFLSQQCRVAEQSECQGFYVPRLHRSALITLTAAVHVVLTDCVVVGRDSTFCVTVPATALALSLVACGWIWAGSLVLLKAGEVQVQRCL